MSRVARIPLRWRVALAFAVSTAVALVLLGVFLQVRVAATLDDQTQATLAARMDTLQRLAPDERDEAVRRLTGETFGQVLAADGRVVAGSPQLRDPVVVPGGLPDVGEQVTRDADVFLASEGESAPAVLRAVGTGDGALVVGVSTEDVSDLLEGLRTQLVVGGALVLLLASGLGYVVAGTALRPMERMRARAATISAGSSGERLPLPEVDDEVRRLGRTLNDMLDRLDTALRRERQFVAEASHELRTPLALLRTELDLAGSRPRDGEELAALLGSATEEVDRLSALVDQLLLLARADEDRLELEVAPVAVRELLEQVAGRFATAADGRRVSVAPGPPAMVEADRARLDQVVSNLVDNALRHGRGDVVLAASREPGSLRVTVADEGGPVPDDELFDRFRRGDGSRAGGRGLGLALVRAIVEEHGGTVWFDAASATTTVVVDLPA